jgi:hypothetical protein
VRAANPIGRPGDQVAGQKTVYRALLYCYPAAFRHEFCDQMLAMFSEQIYNARQSGNLGEQHAIWMRAASETFRRNLKRATQPFVLGLWRMIKGFCRPRKQIDLHENARFPRRAVFSQTGISRKSEFRPLLFVLSILEIRYGERCHIAQSTLAERRTVFRLSF